MTLYLSPQAVGNLHTLPIMERQPDPDGHIVRTIGLAVLDPVAGAGPWRVVILGAPYCCRWKHLDGKRFDALDDIPTDH